MMAVTEQDPDNRAAKARGELCFAYGCQVPRPRFGVLRKCAAGHRLELLYCADHGPELLALALERAAEGGGLYCGQCPGGVLMALVTEGLAPAGARGRR